MIFWRGNPHLCVSPLSSLRLAIHPFVALLEARRISPSAEGDKGYAPLTARAFEKARPKLFKSIQNSRKESEL